MLHRYHVPGSDSTRMIKFQVAKSQRVKCFPLFEGSSEVSGNWGLLDQVAALTWVHTHIGAFGGDPRHVALAADRGGADVASIHLLTTRTANSRLFRRAVLMVSRLFCLQPCCRCWPGKVVLSCLLRPLTSTAWFSLILSPECAPCLWPSFHAHVSQDAEGSPDCCPLVSKVVMILDGDYLLGVSH